VPELDPYLTLGVPRSASREEIARAYRRLAKQHHPDAGAAPTEAMGRINEAWHILSDPTRRARWDRRHTVVQPPHWTAAPGEPIQRRPIREPDPPPSRMDSGRAAVLVVAGVAVLIGAVLIGLNAAFGRADSSEQFTSDRISFRYDPMWTLYPGDPQAAGGQSVIAHLATYDLAPDERCTSAGAPCLIAGELMPVGAVSLLFTSWSEGAPEASPSPDTLVGGEPAAVEVTQVDNVYVGWWQLSPPGFPDRWIEVRADFRATSQIDVDRAFIAIQDILDTVIFGE
jgi:DnaJ domain